MQVIVNVFVPVFVIITSSVLPKGLLFPDQSPDAIQELGTAPETTWEISTDWPTSTSDALADMVTIITLFANGAGGVLVFYFSWILKF